MEMVFLILKIINDHEVLPTLGGLLEKAYTVMLYEECELWRNYLGTIVAYSFSDT